MKIAVIGGGAAGLMAAAAAVRSGCACVDVYERNARVGKKLLATGNGRCNLTSAREADDLAAFSGAYSDGSAALAVLRKVGPADTLAFFSEMGLMTRVEDGGVYPWSMQAASVLDALRLYLRRGGVRERCGVAIEDVRPSEEGFTLAAADGARLAADRVVVACGGPAQAEAPAAMLATLARLGHRVRPFVPGLVPMKCGSAFLKGLNGIRLEASATLCLNGAPVACERGELLFKDYGVSGIAVFQLSAEMAARVSGGETGRFTLALDLFPDRSGELRETLMARRAANACEQAAELFTGILPRRVGENVLAACGTSPSAKIGELDTEIIAKAAARVDLGEVRLLPFSRAQVAFGGVALEEINLETMESRRVPGLYLAGEAVDIAGRCGGYNLQWAWSSGYLAGRTAWSK